jgi:hypothetical protein
MKGKLSAHEQSLSTSSIIMPSNDKIFFHIFHSINPSSRSLTNISTHPGIISSLAFSPSTPTSFYAAGTLAPIISSIGLYDASVDEAVMYLGLGKSERRKVGGGVTQVRHLLTRPPCFP